jgi:pimeloyl-ACP methyl ester carboxylesterase
VVRAVLQRLPAAHVHRLPGLGHLAHEEAPGAVAEIIASIISQLLTQPA